MKTLLIAASALVLLSSSALAQTNAVPPPKAIKLSELIAKVEARDKFQYIGDVEWSQSGYYEITYFTTDKAKVEIKLDPATGEPK